MKVWHTVTYSNHTIKRIIVPIRCAMKRCIERRARMRIKLGYMKVKRSWLLAFLLWTRLGIWVPRQFEKLSCFSSTVRVEVFQAANFISRCTLRVSPIDRVAIWVRIVARTLQVSCETTSRLVFFVPLASVTHAISSWDRQLNGLRVSTDPGVWCTLSVAHNLGGGLRSLSGSLII